jgi:hypothetical protein
MAVKSQGDRDREIVVSQSPREAGVRQAGHYLRELLRHDPYRGRWLRYGSQRAREVHQIAVAKTLAGYLQRHGDDDVEYGQLTRRVSRAFRGEMLSRQTLTLFIRAFEISEEHSGVLWRQWQGAELSRVVVGDLPPLRSPAPRESRFYRTVLLHEFHYIGSDGRPLRHRTLRDIQARVDGLATYRYGFDTDELTVDQIGGGTPGRPYQRAENVWAVDVALSRTLSRGDEHSLEFMSTFHYAHPVEPCFRSVAHERLENVAFRVQFHPDKLPQTVWWTEWQDYREPDAVVIHRQPVALDAEHVAYHRIDVLDQAVAGFSWQF